jgi:imidazolonepropionase-like amidohydrolase
VRLNTPLRAAAVLAALVLALPTRAPAQDLVIVGATILDGRGGPPLVDGVLVVRNGEVAAVGPRSHTSVPKGVTVMDGRGRYVVPGLIDSHVHFFQSGGAYTRPDVIDLRRHRSYETEITQLKAALPRTFARYLLCGVTSVADVGGPMWNFEVRDTAARTALAPRVAVAGPLISTVARPQLDLGDPPIVKVAGPDEARALVKKLVARKPDLVKVWFIFRPEDDLQAGKAVVAATVEEARAAGVRTAVHATQLATARAAVEAGAAVLVHSVTDAPVDDAFLKLLNGKDVLYIPTLFVTRGYDLVLSGRFTPTPAEERWGDRSVMATFEELKGFPEFPGKGRGPRDDRIAFDNLKRVVDAGIAVALGTDAGNIGTLHGASVFRELRLMAEAGMTTAQILTAATRNGARVMGRGKELGTLEVGKRADLLVLDRDPLADVSNFEAIREVIKDGRVLPQAELRQAAGP